MGHLAEVIWRNHHRGSPGRRCIPRFLPPAEPYLQPSRTPRINSPQPLFNTWRADLEENETIRVHPMFDDTPVLVRTPSDMTFLAEHDHEYDSYYERPSQHRSEDPPQAQPEDTPQPVDLPQPEEDPAHNDPSTSNEAGASAEGNQPCGWRSSTGTAWRFTTTCRSATTWRRSCTWCSIHQQWSRSICTRKPATQIPTHLLPSTVGSNCAATGSLRWWGISSCWMMMMVIIIR